MVKNCCTPRAVHPGLLSKFSRGVSGLAALLVVASVPVAQAAMSWHVEPSTVALGEPVTLTLTSKPGMLDKLDLAPLVENFEIHGRNQGSDGKEESLVLTLYPLHTGRFALPNLGFRGRPPTLTVNEQSGNVPKVRFQFEITPGQYHIRQYVRLTIEACDDGSLMWQRPQLPTREGLLLRALNEEQVDVERDGERCTAHRWHWSALPAMAGGMTLNVPMLEANKFGQRLRFPPPEARLDALAVPSWLPPDVAIGKPEISAMPIPEEWPVNRPLAWRIQVGGSYTADALRNLLHMQMANRPQLARYEPVVEETGNDNGVPRYAVNLYSTFSESGNVNLPELIFPWYDIESGKLQQVKLPASNLQVFSPGLRRMVNWLVDMVAMLAIFSLGYLLWRMLVWRLRKRLALTDLERVSDVAELSRKLCAFSLKPRSMPAATLGEWRQRMQKETQTPGLPELVEKVEAARYGLSHVELNALLQQARSCLAAARPVQGTWRFTRPKDFLQPF